MSTIDHLQAPILDSRFVGRMRSSEDGPILIFIGGIHGNEPAGVMAMEKVLSELQQGGMRLEGSLHFIRGNLRALEQEKRFLKKDLNRIWTAKSLSRLLKTGHNLSAEESELMELKGHLDDLINSSRPVYIIDLHTTSGPTQPFIIIDDTLANRRFARQFPLPLVLGLDEYLPGTLLSHYRSRGLITIGMEGGQHEDPLAVKHCISFIWLVLEGTGCLKLTKQERVEHLERLQHASERTPGVYDIWHREFIAPDMKFELQEGFTSFQMLETGTHLGMKENEPMILPRRSRIFMPRYQEQGEDGFFLMRRLPGILLTLSENCRAWQLGKLLALLPGMNRVAGRPGVYTVRDKLFRICGEGLWHFLGYRVYRTEDGNWRLESRDSLELGQEYRAAPWYKKRRPAASFFS